MPMKTGMNFLFRFVANMRQLMGVIMFALGLVRWYQTPEGKALLAAMK